MSQAHKGSILPIKNQVLSADNDTLFLAHYDLNEHDVLNGVKAVGNEYALDFNSSVTEKQYIDTELVPPQTGTIEFMVWPHQFYNNNIIFENEVDPDDWKCWIDSSGVIAFKVNNTRAYYTLSNTQAWYHIAFIWNYDTKTVKLYVNGTLRRTVTETGWVQPQKMTIGGRVNEKTQAKLMDFRVWDYEFTEQDVLKYGVEKPLDKTPGLLAWWKFNEGQGSMVLDYSTYHNDGIITGTPIWSTGNSVFTLRKQEGKFGGAIAVEEETTNLYFDKTPTLTDENNTLTVLPWSERHNGNPITRIQKAVGAPSVEASYRYCFTLTPENDATLSFKVKLLSGDISSIAVHYGGGTLGNALKKEPIGGGWWYCTYTGKVPSGGVLCAGIGFYGEAAVDCLLTEMQLEEKPFATSFVSGSRPSGLLEYPQSAFPLDTQGTFSCWARTHNNLEIDRTIIYQWEVGGGTNGQFGLRMRYNGGMRLVVNGTYITSNTRYNDGKWHFYTVTWINGTDQWHLYVDGVLVGSATEPITLVNTRGRRDQRIPIGHRGWTYKDEHWNGLFDEVRIDNVARTAEEIQTWYYSNSPFWPRGIYHKSY